MALAAVSREAPVTAASHAVAHSSGASHLHGCHASIVSSVLLYLTYKVR